MMKPELMFPISKKKLKLMIFILSSFPNVNKFRYSIIQYGYDKFINYFVPWYRGSPILVHQPMLSHGQNLR